MNANAAVRWLEDPKSAVRWLGEAGGGTLGVVTFNLANCQKSCLDLAPEEQANCLNICLAQALAIAHPDKVPSLKDCMNNCLTLPGADQPACLNLCAAQHLAKWGACFAGYAKDEKGNCVPISANIGCATAADCKAGQECFQGICVDPCPAGQVHDPTNEKNCIPKPAPVATAGMGNWGILLLAAATAGALWFAFRGAGVTAGP